MQRRKFLIGAGSLAAGGAAVMGTGAFAVDAQDRTATGTVVNDNQAYLGLEPNANDGYSEIGDDGELKVTLDSLNQNSVTQLDEVFYIRNNGTVPVDVQITDVDPANANNTASVTGATVSSTGADLLNNFGATVNPGDSIGVSITIDVPDAPAGQSSEFSFHVDADES